MSEKNIELIAYCGFYCGDCVCNSKIPDAASNLVKELSDFKFDRFVTILVGEEFGKAFKNYDHFSEVLDALSKMRCDQPCRGAHPNCKIWACCRGKKLDGCWECAEFETCNNFDFLKAFHGDANVNNLRKLKKNGKEEFLKGEREF